MLSEFDETFCPIRLYSGYLFIYLFIYLFTYSFIYLFTYLFISIV